MTEFDQFMKSVNKHIRILTHGMLVANDLTDFMYYDAYEDGCDPKDVALDALENDMIGSGMLQ